MFEGWTIRKVMGGQGEFSSCTIFFVNISLTGIFFSRVQELFSGLLAVHEFFSHSIFPCMNFFVLLPTPIPIYPFILMYKVKHNHCPKYISDLFKRTSCNYALRNPDFSVPRVNTVTFGKHSVSYLGPVLWSKLSPEVKQSKTMVS